MHSLDHMGTMHTLNIMKNETKYLGGLRLAIKFKYSVSAEEFLRDEKRWRDWFKWIVSADQHDLQYERIAWIKILGVPLALWDENNFSTIARRFGKVINPFDNISTRRDYSMGMVGVITSARKWINEEITIVADGVEYQVGVVKYTDDWSPFKPIPFDKVEESDDEEDIEGVSDTWMAVEEQEEGDFRPNDDSKKQGETKSPVEVDGNVSAFGNPVSTEAVGTNLPETEPPIIENCVDNNNVSAFGNPVSIEAVGTNLPATEPPIIENRVDNTNDKFHIPKASATIEIPQNQYIGTQLCINENMEHMTPILVAHTSKLPDIGPIQNLVPLGCFGLFPNNKSSPFSFKSSLA
ncbi:unnamed protein product [Lactuca virosa]|uniref:DUF4283 domain-containing protein n=1 Tax=Lactuca virosa TaxID=75947 RepID=A0AAU9PL30_9ASTR|nr:unnamed protein product [Lactuca virosa]